MTRRLLASYLAVTMLTLLLLGVPLAAFFAQRERDRLAGDLEHDATVIATIYEEALEQGVPLDPGPAAEYHARTGARVVVVDREGTSRADTGAPVGRDFSTRPEMIDALGGERATGTRSSDTLATDIFYVAVPIASGGTVQGALRLTIDTSDVTRRIHRFWLGLAGAGALIIGIVALVGWWLATSVTRPIRQLQADADRYSHGDLSVEPRPSRGPPEVRALADTITAMAARLDELLAAQRAFVADASHQLRSPLTALTLRLENLEDRVPEDVAADLDRALEEADRLSHLVNDLLQLARVDERPSLVAVDLARLAAERVDTWTAVADTLGVVLRTSGLDTPAMVDAVPGAVEQILDNLLDNALNASPAGSTISIAITSRPHEHDLGISDEGSGLDDEQKSLATGRFWRSSTSGDGTGLGLAIVEALTRASGGRLRLSDSTEGGLAVTVTLMASGASSPTTA